MTTSASPEQTSTEHWATATLKFHDLSRFLKLPKDSLNLRAGQFELDLPFSQARTWNLSGWDIFSEANIGIQNGLGPAAEREQRVRTGRCGQRRRIQRWPRLPGLPLLRCGV